MFLLKIFSFNEFLYKRAKKSKVKGFGGRLEGKRGNRGIVGSSEEEVWEEPDGLWDSRWLEYVLPTSESSDFHTQPLDRIGP